MRETRASNVLVEIEAPVVPSSPAALDSSSANPNPTPISTAASLPDPPRMYLSQLFSSPQSLESYLSSRSVSSLFGSLIVSIYSLSLSALSRRISRESFVSL